MDGLRNLPPLHACSHLPRASGCLSPEPWQPQGRTALAWSYLLEFRLILISFLHLLKANPNRLCLKFLLKNVHAPK